MEAHGAVEQAVITEDVEIIGTIKATNGLRLDGKLNGDLNCGNDVVIGKNANVKGNLAVNSVSVNGQITGNVTAKDRIELKAAARIAGDIKAKRLTVEDGVSFVGKVEVNPSGIAGSKSVTPETQAQSRDQAEEKANEAVADTGDKAGEKGRGIGFLGRRP